MTEETTNTRIVTSLNYPIRFSFFKAITGEMVYDKKKETEVRKWSSMILIPKTDKNTVDRFKKVINFVAREKWGENIPKNLKISFRDGDKEGKGGLPDGTEIGTDPYPNNFFLSARSDRQPTVVDQNLQPVIDPDTIVSGDYGRVSLNCFPFDNKHGKGISFGLGNIQLVRKGEPLGGTRIAPDKEFTPISEATDGDAGNNDSNDVFDV